MARGSSDASSIGRRMGRAGAPAPGLGRAGPDDGSPAPLVPLEVARRFVLGRQGLWPGRRWEGRRGLLPALRYIGSVQFDPLDVVGRSHDLALWGRIVGYETADLYDALYQKRTVFESGGNVQIRPIEERAYLGIVMERKVAEDRWRRFARSKARLLDAVSRDLERRGPLGAGDFQGPKETRITNYRARTESGLALYYLWLRGDVMIAFRRRGEKVFDLTSRLLPTPVPEVPVDEAEEHLILDTLRRLGLASGSEWLARAHARIGRSSLRYEWAERLRRWRDGGVIQEVEVDGWKGRKWLLAEAAADLEVLRTSGVPRDWRPRSTTTQEEVVFLAPLELTTASGRAAHLFDFEYRWEVYKPPSARRWGYYTLPILFGDRPVARIELKHDRTSDSLETLGFWPDDPALRRDAEFAEALGRALARLADFRRAKTVRTAGLHSPAIERKVAASVAANR